MATSMKSILVARPNANTSTAEIYDLSLCATSFTPVATIDLDAKGIAFSNSYAGRGLKGGKYLAMPSTGSYNVQAEFWDISTLASPSYLGRSNSIGITTGPTPRYFNPDGTKALCVWTSGMASINDLVISCTNPVSDSGTTITDSVGVYQAGSTVGQVNERYAFVSRSQMMGDPYCFLYDLQNGTRVQHINQYYTKNCRYVDTRLSKRLY